jgi:hypothetical protein
MSLAHLLTTSGSLGRKENDTHRYKMMNPLPKFAPVKRPVSLTPRKTVNGEQNAMQTETLVAKPETSSVADGSAGKVGANEGVMGVLSIGVFQKESGSAATPQGVAKAMNSKSWFSKLWSMFRKQKPTGAGPFPIQTEWSLDKVKVIRNDLSDVDLDIVFASVDAGPVKKSPAKKDKLVGSAWRRVNPTPTKQEQMVLK